MILAVTGHRPDKLWGYDINTKPYKELAHKMIEVMTEVNATHLISGMALGVDTVFAFAALKYRNDNPLKKIVIECAIPCRNHTGKWQQDSKNMYLRILEEADIITKVSNESYQSWLMQKRNEYMVDKCNLLLAVWDGSSGGTGNCVRYAMKVGREIRVIDPREIDK